MARGRENILKRYLVHVAAFNVSLVMRQMLGVGTPRGLGIRSAALFDACCGLVVVLWPRMSLGYQATMGVAVNAWPTLTRH